MFGTSIQQKPVIREPVKAPEVLAKLRGPPQTPLSQVLEEPQDDGVAVEEQEPIESDIPEEPSTSEGPHEDPPASESQTWDEGRKEAANKR